ncbi:hypothetical protein SAY87_002296 [Trapa incisa]|uniref:Histone-lysine N-methyltransferase ATXR5 n=1 Tax=Trapa incisa TaxID=236973 RepID=A0AAN7JVH3_9MYRT|nr:hypothetical protein SAY87_002296 [Trapa incisa]
MTKNGILPRSSDGRVSKQSTMRLELTRLEEVKPNSVKDEVLSPCMMSPSSVPQKKRKSMTEILAVAKYAVVERDDYNNVNCEKCGSGDQSDEILLCDKCDKGFHMKCLRPIVVRVPFGSWFCPECCGQRRVRRFPQNKVLEFFRIQKSCETWDTKDGSLSPQDSRKRRRRWAPPVFQKKRRRLLPFIPHKDHDRRLQEMSSLASALTASKMEFCDDLYYSQALAPRSANQAKFEKGGIQVLPREDIETFEQCRAMCKTGIFPPLVVRYDSCEGLTVEADAPIKDMTFITEYTGDVDFLDNRNNDDCDGIMTLLLANDPSKSLVICPDKRGNIARFINGINNHSIDGKKKQNCKCVRYNVNGECRVLIVATRDIAEGERLYYDYNGHEDAYPTHHFI